MPHIGLLLHLIERECREDKWENALRLLDRAERHVSPDDREAVEFLLYRRGYALLELQRPQEAAESLGRLVDLDGCGAPQRLLLADALIRAGRWEEALAQLEAALAEEPDHPECLCAMGWTLYQTGEKEEARALLERALEIHPSFHPAHLDLGLIHAAERRWDAAEAHLVSALAAIPEDPEIGGILAAVRYSRALAMAERLRVWEIAPRLRARRSALDAAEARQLRLLRRALRQRGATHLEVLLAENLWLDFAQTTEPRAALDPAWSSGVAYTALRLNGRAAPRAALAREWGVGLSTLARRHRALRDGLDLARRGPLYTARGALPTPGPAASEPRPGGGRPVGAQIIPVDFAAGTRLPALPPCPCGSGLPAGSCRHG